MVSMLRWLGSAIFLVLALAGGTYVAAGRTAPAMLSIDQPTGPIGQAGTLQVTAQAPGASLATVEGTITQNGRVFPLFNQTDAEAHTLSGADAVRVDADHLRITRSIGKASIADLQAGPATITVTATRRSFLELREIQASVSREVQVSLEPPRLAVLSTTHYVNHGGSEMVMYRATPADVVSGVRVGTVEYRGYPAAAAGIPNADPALKVAFFGLLVDQPLQTPIVAFARDAAGNEATAQFVDRVFEKAFRKSRIPVDDRFFNRAVPAILEHSPGVTISTGSYRADNPNDPLAGFLKVNGDVRQMNARTIIDVTASSAAQKLWSEPFMQLGNSQVEAAFADARTYVYNGKDVDQQTHLGFDLAVTSHVAVLSANAGRVLYADWLGIYGNCVIVDHGLGVASLYGHLSSLAVKVGDSVTRGQELGRSGTTGLAAGDHLHFTMLVGGHAVNPVEWWDAHWIQDRVLRKLAEAGAPAASGTSGR